jgi:hypothetical protein
VTGREEACLPILAQATLPSHTLPRLAARVGCLALLRVAVAASGEWMDGEVDAIVTSRTLRCRDEEDLGTKHLHL